MHPGQHRGASGYFEGHPRAVFFGGAGMSTESGTPDFRSANGIYSRRHVAGCISGGGADRLFPRPPSCAHQQDRDEGGRAGGTGHPRAYRENAGGCGVGAGCRTIKQEAT
ncbi:MAG: hypothetical protein IKR65_06000 [Selenomonadaceae bacterium]|nr:hypothetical protein [Selenomonadaceae bacterium]